MTQYFVRTKPKTSEKVIYTPFNKKSTAMKDAKITKKIEGSKMNVRVVKATDSLKKNLIKSKVGNYYLKK